MSYFIINKQPVFLSAHRYAELKRQVSVDKGADWRIASVFQGRKENRECQEMMFEALNGMCTKNPECFVEEWVRFDFRGADASENAWDLLWDFCHFYGYAFLSDLRDTPNRLAADLENDSYLYPMGRIFALDHVVRPGRWWWRFAHKMVGRKVTLLINTARVRQLSGSLAEFELNSDSFRLFCGKDILIF